MVDSNIIVIEPVMDLANINILYDACQAAYQGGSAEVKLDASKVERAKTPVFQLLLILKQALESENRTLVIEGATESFNNMAACIGLKDALA